MAHSEQFSRRKTRRAFLQSGAAGAVALAFAGCEAADKRKAADEMSVSIQPRGTLVISGGGLSAEKWIPAFCSEHHVRLEQLENPDSIAPEVRQLMREQCDPSGIYRYLANHCELQGRTVVCVTSASEDAVPNALYYRRLFRILGAGRVVTITDRNEAESAAAAQLIGDAKTCLVYFGGGKQDRLAVNFKNTACYNAMRERYITDDRFTVGGHSAGAAVMSGELRMINGWNEANTAAKLDSGFALLPHVIVETHLHRESDRPRLPRLQSALDEHPNCIGIGMEDGTGIVLKNGKATVVGKGRVWKVSPGDAKCPLKQSEPALPCNRRGETFDIGEFANMEVTKSFYTAARDPFGQPFARR